MKSTILLNLSLGFSIISVNTFAQNTQLEQSNNLERKLSSGEKHNYVITLQKGEYASCVIMQKGVDIAIDLFNPGGKKIRTFDSPNGTDGPEPINIIAEETGKYQLYVYPMNDQSYLTDSVSKAQFAQQNQGLYAIIDVIRLSPEGYKKKLDLEAANKLSFTEWLTNNSHSLSTVDAGKGYTDLQPFKQILKNISVVGLGESSHGTSEFFRMKHRLLEFLVNEMGYNSFYIEASMASCRYINDYVLYGKGNLDTATVIQGFITWRVEEVRNMIEWIRVHNKTVAIDKKVKFMGYDLQGNSYAWKDLKNFYSIVNPSMSYLIDSLKEQRKKAATLSNAFTQKEQQEGATLFAIANKSCLEILSDINLRQGQYEYATNKDVYEQNLMNIKLIIQETESYKDGYNDRRDYYMAQNIMWLLNKEKKGAKVVVWAHNGHIEKLSYPKFGSMGYYLNQYLKDKYYAMGFEFYQGSFKTRNFDLNNQSMNWDIVTIGEPPVESLPWYFNKTGKSKLFIDFRKSGYKNVTLFSQSIEMHSFGSGYSPKYGKQTFSDKMGNFDGMIFIKESSAAKNFPDIILN
jgi:erythromycin esterase